MGMADHVELALHEERAQHGIIEFAEEMQTIREKKLYPNAGKTDAWASYCKERWGMAESSVRQTIAALPVLQRLSDAPSVAGIGVKAAAAVATLPESVQDAILADAPKQKVVTARAKAARQVQKKAEKRGEPVDETVMAKAALAAKPAKEPKPSAPMAPKDDLRPLQPDERGHEVLRELSTGLHAIWRAYKKAEDAVLDEHERELLRESTERGRRLLDALDAYAQGEGRISDEDLEAFMESLR